MSFCNHNTSPDGEFVFISINVYCGIFIEYINGYFQFFTKNHKFLIIKNNKVKLKLFNQKFS